MPFINDQLAHNQEKIHQNDSEKYISRFKFDVDLVMGLLRSRIIGQQQIIEQLENILITLKADFSDPNQPLAVVLLTGPTGVGKTETVRVLCEAIYHNVDAMCRIDMNTLAQEHYSAALLGAPPGYAGSKEGYTLLNQDKIKGSFSKPGIVLLDEIEKADKQVSRSIMNILDTGKLALTSGQTEIDFTNSIIFMTSNIGADTLNKETSWIDKIYQSLFLKHGVNKNKLDQNLRKYFDPEFINRIDYTLKYKPLNLSYVMELVDSEIEHLNKRLKKKQVFVSMTFTCKQKIAESYNHQYGARDIKRIIKQKIEPILAKKVLTSNHEKAYLVDWENEFKIESEEIKQPIK